MVHTLHTFANTMQVCVHVNAVIKSTEHEFGKPDVYACSEKGRIMYADLSSWKHSLKFTIHEKL